MANTTKFVVEAWMRISSGLPARTFSPTVALLFLLSLPPLASPFNEFVDVDALVGLFLYYDENSATPKSFPSSPLSGISESWIERKTQIFDAFIEVGSGPDMAKVDGSKTLHAAGVFKPDVKTPFLDKDSRMIYCLCAYVIVCLPDVRYLSSGSA